MSYLFCCTTRRLGHGRIKINSSGKGRKEVKGFKWDCWGLLELLLCILLELRGSFLFLCRVLSFVGKCMTQISGDEVWKSRAAN